MEIVNQNLNLATAQRLTEDRTTAQKDIRESCDEVHQSIKESRDAILEAQATRRPSPPPPSILLNGPKKLRKRAGDHDIRATSALHRRKPSWQGSIGSVKTFTQRCGSKGREVFRSRRVGQKLIAGYETSVLTDVHYTAVGEDRSLAAMYQTSLGQESTLSNIRSAVDNGYTLLVRVSVCCHPHKQANHNTLRSV
ncbi:hypothetical protein KCU77_g2046, partial [Aureobasidium melanogenum]